jgi:hypothetical protein
VAEDKEKKEEGKFEFTAEGEALGYIGMDQAQVRAMQVATETPGDYGSAYSGIRMAFEVVNAQETEDHYVITLSLRPLGDFSGRPGQERFFIEKEGAIAHRQLLAFPRPRRRFPVIPVAMGLAVAGVVAVIAVLAAGGLGQGDDSQPSAAASLPTTKPIPATQTPLPTPTEAQAVVPSSEATATPEPAATTRPSPAPTLEPTSTANPRPTTTPTSIYNLTILSAPAEGGTVSPSGGAYDAGSTVTLTATPQFPYALESWTGTENDNINPTAVTLNGHTLVTANFKELSPTPEETVNGLLGGPAPIGNLNLTAGQWVQGELHGSSDISVHIVDMNNNVVKDFGRIRDAYFTFQAPSNGTYAVVVYRLHSIGRERFTLSYILY